jgi:hypothetical protein
MNEKRREKTKSVVMSFAVDEESAERIRKIPSHTTHIRDLVLKDCGICPTCRQPIPDDKEQ